jgi:perosamine synthetase
MSSDSRSREPGAPVPAGSIPLCIPFLGGNEWTFVKECLDTNFVSSVGPFVDRFEQAVAARAGTTFGVATVNGTAALHVALRIAGVETGDEVLVSTLTFIAPVNAIRYLDAIPVFIDAEPVHYQMDPAAVRAYLHDECERRGDGVFNRRTGRRVRAIVPVHILGHPVDMDPVLALARECGLVVVEDATESLGALYKGMPVGSLGDMGCFSFNGNKLITTGGGGLLVTNDEGIAQRAKYLTTQAKTDAVEFIHGEVGYNYRLTNVNAAIGMAQMERLDAHIAAKRALTARYTAALAPIRGITTPVTAAWASSVDWLYTILVDEEAFGMDSRTLMRALDGAGIQSRPLWQPAHRSPSQRDMPARDCPVADDLNRRALSLPSSVGITEAEQDRVIATILQSCAEPVASPG